MATVSLMLMTLLLVGASLYAGKAWVDYNKAQVSQELYDAKDCTVMDKRKEKSGSGYIIELNVTIDGETKDAVAPCQPLLPDAPLSDLQATNALRALQKEHVCFVLKDPEEEEEEEICIVLKSALIPILCTVVTAVFAIFDGWYAYFIIMKSNLIFRRTNTSISLPHVSSPEPEDEDVVSELQVEQCLKEVDPEDVAELDACLICLDEYSTEERNFRAYSLPCMHVFHFLCIKRWIMTQRGRRCPVCNVRAIGGMDRTPEETSTHRAVGAHVVGTYRAMENV